MLVGIVRVLRDMRGGAYSEAELEELLRSRGLMNRLLGRFTNAVPKSWQMYPLGVLFGLGFDTASEVALLFLAAGAAGAGLPWYAILCLPVLFAAGMSLLDTIDGSFMNFAYGWAFSQPVRKVFYNLTVTGLSVAVALVIGTIELLSIAVERLDLSGGFWGWIAGHRPQRGRLRRPGCWPALASGASALGRSALARAPCAARASRARASSKGRAGAVARSGAVERRSTRPDGCRRSRAPRAVARRAATERTGADRAAVTPLDAQLAAQRRARTPRARRAAQCL